MTKVELYAIAKELGIPSRSRMNKAQLEVAISFFIEQEQTEPSPSETPADASTEPPPPVDVDADADKQLQDTLEVMAGFTRHDTSQVTLGEYMEGTGDGFSIRNCEPDTESFSEASLGLDQFWKTESTGLRYSTSREYPYNGPDTSCDVNYIAKSAPVRYPEKGLDPEAVTEGHFCNLSSLHIRASMCLELLSQYSSAKQTNGEDPSYSLSRLDSLMCDINGGLLPEARRYIYNTEGPDAPIEFYFPIDTIRSVYLDACDNVLNPVHNSYYCNTGDAPVIFDRNVQWDMLHRSAGGWSDISPETEEDYKQRNCLDSWDASLIQEAEIEERYYEKEDKDGNKVLIKDRGYEFTRYIMRERDERAARVNGYNELLKGAGTTHKLLSTMLRIELTYKRSLYLCERLGAFNNHNLTTIHITRKQLDSLRATFKARFNQLPRPIHRRVIFLMYAVALHQCDKRQGELKASQRIMKVFRSVRKDWVGTKYYNQLKDIKNRMFKHILRNMKNSAPGEKNIPTPPSYLDAPPPEYMQ